MIINNNQLHRDREKKKRSSSSYTTEAEFKYIFSFIKMYKRTTKDFQVSLWISRKSFNSIISCDLPAGNSACWTWLGFFWLIDRILMSMGSSCCRQRSSFGGRSAMTFNRTTIKVDVLQMLGSHFQGESTKECRDRAPSLPSQRKPIRYVEQGTVRLILTTVQW